MIMDENVATPPQNSSRGISGARKQPKIVSPVPEMPTVAGGLPSPTANLTRESRKFPFGLVFAWILVVIMAVTGVILIIMGINSSAEHEPEIEEVARVTEVAPEDCVGSRAPVETTPPAEVPTEPKPGSTTPVVSGAIPASSRTYAGENCTLMQGPLMLINPVFQVQTDYIAARKRELVDISKMYGIQEGLKGNGAPLLDAEAASHLNAMVKAYQEAYPKHTLETRSCFRSAGTSCGRLCYATGTSDHHTGYTCDLIDPSYGTSLNTDHYDQHAEWQWLKANSYKYGFIDRFPAEWAGGPMSEPVNITEDGSTGLFETWHYRYVGVDAATEIATGKYNNGNYDSLEHYLKARGITDSLTAGTCR